MDKTVLITGGAGYVGSHANKALAAKGYRTVIYDDLSRGHRELAKWGDLVVGDLHDRERLRRVFADYPVACVMHFAASAYVGESVIDPQKYYLNNVRNTLTLLEVMLEHKVADLIFSSTCSTYGDPRYLPMTEDHPLEPVNPYGRSKLMVERILRDYAMAYGLRYVSLRYFNAAGADPDGDIGEWHEPETHLIPLALYTALGRRPALQVFGTGYQTPDGTCIRDYVHVSDLAAAHVLAMEHLLRGGASEVFNLGTGGGSSVRQVIDAAQRIAGRPITVIESPPRPGDPPVLVASSAKAMDHLGWRPRYTDIASIVETAWTWHSSRETSVRGR